MAIDGRKLVNYLAHNISPSQIATALNLTPGRVTQLAGDAKIMDAVAKRKTQIAEEGLTDVADLKTVKKTLINRLEDLAQGTESLSEAMRALEAIDNMTAKKLGQEDENSGVQQVIMQVPIFIQQNNISDDTITLDSRNRIVGIKGRSMAQMPTQGVLDILKRGPSDDSETIDQGQEPRDFDLSALAIP